jgi:hypothetical protein
MKPTKKEIREFEEGVKKSAELQVQRERYQSDNRIEFFDHAPNPGPNPKQAQILEAFLDNGLKTFGLSGGNRMGKTTILTILGISVIVGKYLWNGQSLLHLFPHNLPRKVRYVGQGWNDHVKAVVIPEIEKWWPKIRKVKRRGNGVITDTYWRDEKTKGTFEIMSNNQQSKEHEGWSGDLILYDEPCHREIYVANARGLVDRKGREIFAATLLDEPWIDREIIKKTGDDGKPDKTVFWVEGTSTDNVGFGITQEGLDGFADKLRPEEYEARIKGIPAYKSGLILNFSRKYRDKGGHLVERFDVPLDYIVDIGIDVHPRTEQAVVFLATDSRGDRYVIDEIWEHGDGKWLAEEIVRKVQQNSYRVGKVIIDPLAKGDSNNDNTTYDTIAMILMRYEMILEVASKDKDSGILKIKDHLWGPNKQPSIFVFDDCVRTIYEIEGWMWDKDTQKAAKVDDHMMENLYRLLLLDTKWTTPFDDIEYLPQPDYARGRDMVTGY